MAVVVAELEELGISRVKIDELVSLPSTTPTIVHAAVLIARKRPAHYQPGLAIRLIQHPEQIAAKAIKAAEYKLRQRAAKTAAEAQNQSEPDLPLTPDRVQGLISILEHAKEGGQS